MKIKLLPLFFLSIFSYGQNNSTEILKKGVDFVRNNQLSEAIAEFNKIPINDTNYLTAQYEIGLNYFNLKQYDSSNIVFKKLLGLNYGSINEPKVYAFIAYNYESKGDYSQAFELYEKGLSKYTKNNFLRFAQGVSYENQKNYSKAIENYQFAIENCVSHTKSHLRLAMLAANEGRYTEAILGLSTYLIFEENIENRLKVLNFLESICSGSFVAKPVGAQFGDEGEMFEQLNVFIKNKVALQKKYKVNYAFESVIYRQLHLLLSSAKYEVEEQGFFYQMYLPFFKEVYDRGLLDGLVNSIYIGTDNPKISSKLNANKSKTDQFINSFSAIWKDKMYTKYMDFNGKKQFVYVFYRPNSIDYIVPYDIKENKVIGNAVLYNTFGQYVGDTPIDAEGKVTGNKIEFNPETNFKVYDKEYKENQLQGMTYFYHDNGNVYQSIKYVDGKIEDTLRIYFKNGALEKVIPFKNGKKHGNYTTYYETGTIASTYTFKEDKVDGVYKEFHPNGQLRVEAYYENDLNVKFKKIYHSNGKLRGEYLFETKNENNYYNGPFKEYYYNGNLRAEGTYKNGTLIGENKRYDFEGKLSEVRNYEDKSKETFSAVSYDDNGVKLEEFIIKNGLIDQIVLYNDKGEQIKKSTKSNKNIEFSRQNNIRKITIEGNYKGDKEVGTWRYYYNNGVLKSLNTYANGILIDTNYDYHPNGNISAKTTINNGKEEGLYQEFDELGNLIRVGYMHDDKMVNSWTEISSQGNVEKRYTYKDGNLWGKQYYYFATGKLKSTEVYNDDFELISLERFDTAGTIIFNSIFLDGTVTLKDYTNTYIHSKINYLNNKLHGPFEYYYPNGVTELKGEYFLGNKIGKWTTYTIDGKIKYVKNYTDNNLDGIYTEYADNGTIVYKVNYIMGNKHGKAVAYYDNGVIETESVFFNGSLHGKLVDYSSDGMVSRIRFYEYGTLIGYTYLDKTGKELPMIPIANERLEMKAYFKNGQLSIHQTRINGLLDGLHIEYFSTGQLKEQNEYKLGESHGSHKLYYSNGKLESDFTYLNGFKNGISKEYYPSGKVKRELSYLEGELHGPLKEYNEAGKLIRTIYYYESDAYKIVKH